MPWTTENPPKPARNWPERKKSVCVRAANARLAQGGENAEDEAIQACIAAAENVDSSATPPSGGKGMPDRIVDVFAADHVLAGEQVRILPLMEDGYWRGGTQKPPITQEKAQALVANFERRATSGNYQSTIPFNKEHVDVEGKIGSIAELTLGSDGVYASLDLTKEGRRLLENDAFDYLSPEIVWNREDSKTGEMLGPCLIGLAATNYPYFGDATAIFSQEAGERFEASKGADNDAVHTIVERLKPAITATIAALFKRQEEETEMTEKGESGDKMQVPEEFRARMEALEAGMAEQAEQFQRDIEERDGMIATQSQTIEAQHGRIGELEESNLRERFSQQARSLAHVGAEVDALTNELVWLHQADNTDDQAHFAFWSNVLSTYEKSMSDSASFQEAGRSSGPSMPGASDTVAMFNARVAELAKQKGVSVNPGSPEYGELLMAAASADPQLYERYRSEMVPQ